MMYSLPWSSALSSPGGGQESSGECVETNTQVIILVLQGSTYWRGLHCTLVNWTSGSTGYNKAFRLRLQSQIPLECGARQWGPLTQV